MLKVDILDGGLIDICVADGIIEDRLRRYIKDMNMVHGELEHAQEMIANAARYKWLRDNKHLDEWWSTQGSLDRCENIDADIDAAIREQGEL
jgi:hypothetical protein